MAEMLEKIRSGMVGQAEPLLALGADLSAAGVKAKAMELGLVGANGELSNAATMQARFALPWSRPKSSRGIFSKRATAWPIDQILGAQLGMRR